MAKPTTLSGVSGLFFVEDPATAGTFIKICGLDNGTISFEADTADSTVADCDDLDAPAWTEREVVGLSWSMSFEGVLAKEAIPTLETIFGNGLAHKVRLHRVGAGTGVGTPDRRYAGSGILTMEQTGERGSKVTVSIDVQGSGELTWTNVAAL